MGIKNFLKQQGFIQEEPGDKGKENSDNAGLSQQAPATVMPTYFPLTGNATAATVVQPEPSFVTPQQPAPEQPDPTFIKFFEDELAKANLPGPDYFEFRQMLIKTQQKMSAKGVMAPEVILQAVLTSFEAQDIPSVKLVEAARHYKEIIKQKKDDFLKGASAEKNNQLQKRQTVLQAHNDTIQKIQQQLQQLELQKKQLDEALNREKTQLEVNKTLGKEGIEKIDKAERLISTAHDYIQSTIDMDINRLQSL